jgi:lipopolysaccharide exporter
MSLRDRAISSAKWSAISMVSLIGIQFVQGALLARLLHPFELGLASMVSLVATFAELFLDMGLSTAIVQRRNISEGELSSLYWMNAFWGLVIGGCLMAGSGIAAWLFSAPNIQPIICLAAVIFMVIPHGQQYRSLMERELMFETLSKIEVISSCVLFAATLLAATHDGGAYSPIIGALTSATVRTVLLNYYGRALYTPSLHFKFSETRPYLSFGLYQAMTWIVNYLNVNFGGIIAGRILGAVALGGYSLSLNSAVNLPARLNPIFTRVVFPVFSIIQDDRVKLRQNYYKLSGLIALVNFPVVFGLMVIAPHFIYCVFGEKWLWITPVMRVLCLVGAFRCIGNPVESLLMATANVKTNFRFSVAKTVLLLPAIIVGAHLGGAIGVALALLTIEALAFLPIYFVLLRPVLGPSFSDYLKAYIVPLRLTMPMVASVWLASILLDASLSHVMALAIQVLVGAASFGLLIFFDSSVLCREVRGMALHALRKA